MTIAVLWMSPDGKTANGVWRCEPSTIRLIHPFDETFVVVEGKMTFTPVAGEPRTLQAGDVIVIPRGAENVMEVHERVTKVWTCTPRTASRSSWGRRPPPRSAAAGARRGC